METEEILVKPTLLSSSQRSIMMGESIDSMCDISSLKPRLEPELLSS
jgi:hypothetical protein